MTDGPWASEAGTPAPTGVIDYAGAMAGRLPDLTFFDSRQLTARLTGDELAHLSLRAASGLRRCGAGPGDPVLLIAESTPHFVVTLLGCLLSGAVPCAVAPAPHSDDLDSAGVRHVAAASDVVRPRLLVGTDPTSPNPSRAPFASYADLLAAPALPPNAIPPDAPERPHHIQLSSGSTSTPKAVLLTHQNVASQIRALGTLGRLDREQSRIFSWLPLYHDMGLIQLLAGLLHGRPVDLMPPHSFLRDPLAWLRHMSTRASTHTAAPPFAFRATQTAAARLTARDRPLDDIDLRHLEQAYVGAEPIPYDVLAAFTRTFAERGLRDDVLIPCYGMAETVLAATVAMDQGPTGPTGFGRVQARHLDAAAGRVGLIVSCGSPVPGVQVRVADDDGPCSPGTHGQIQVKGESVMAGYLVEGRIEAPPRGWHDTGDLGVIVDGELYVVGRRKEVIIVRGRNFLPYDLEEAVEGVPGVGAGHSVVFSVPDQGRGTETLVAVVESRADASERHELSQRIETAVRASSGLTLNDIVLVPRGAIDRTTSGKRQRSAVRERYLRKDLAGLR